MNTTTSESWSGRMAFILASIGAAVGLGNIWKFPYTLGSSGGSAFVLVYVIAILLVATPIMISEMIIGRHARASAPTAMRKVALESGTTRHWGLLGWMGLFALFLVLSFYSVVAGWTAAYLVKTATGSIAGLSAAEVGAGFSDFTHNSGEVIFWHLLFTATTIFIVSRGVKIGLERVVRVLMPALFITLIALVINSAFIGDFSTTIRFPVYRRLEQTHARCSACRNWAGILLRKRRHRWRIDLLRLSPAGRQYISLLDHCGARRYAGCLAGRAGDFSDRFCQQPGSGRRSGTDICNVVYRVCENAGRCFARRRLLPDAGIRSPDLVDLHAGNDDGENHRDSRHDSYQGSRNDWYRYLSDGPGHRILVQQLGERLSSGMRYRRLRARRRSI